jgi:hypothetical protein
MTLLELLIGTFLLSGLLLSMGHALTLGFAWGRTADDVMRTKMQADRLARALSKSLRQGTPLEVLSIDASGNILETAVADAQETWRAENAVILRGAEAYSVIAQQGTRLIRRQIGRDGHVRSEPLVHGIRAARFGVVRGDAGTVLGIDYELEFSQQGRPMSGFVGIRTDASPTDSSPGAPARAPRYRRGGDR